MGQCLSLFGQETRETVNRGNSDNFTPLMKAILFGEIKKIKRLLALGADVNAKDYHGQTVLRLARWKGNPEIFRLIIDAKPNLNTQDRNGFTVLHMAISDAQLEIIQMLIAAGADINIKDDFGISPLQQAISKGHKDILEILQPAENQIRRMP